MPAAVVVMRERDCLRKAARHPLYRCYRRHHHGRTGGPERSRGAARRSKLCRSTASQLSRRRAVPAVQAPGSLRTTTEPPVAQQPGHLSGAEAKGPDPPVCPSAAHAKIHPVANAAERSKRAVRRGESARALRRTPPRRGGELPSRPPRRPGPRRRPRSPAARERCSPLNPPGCTRIQVAKPQALAPRSNSPRATQAAQRPSPRLAPSS